MFGLLENVEKLNDFENELGKFSMYRYAETSYEYWGEVDWRTPNGGKVKARVPCENEKKCFAKLADALADAAVWERRLKEHALKYFLEEYGIDDGLIGIWGSVEELSDGVEITPVTQEEFIKRIRVHKTYQGVQYYSS